MTEVLIGAGVVGIIVVGLAIWLAWRDANTQPTRPLLLLARRGRESRRVPSAATAQQARVPEEDVEVVAQAADRYPPPAVY